jgi:hypothetical protein
MDTVKTGLIVGCGVVCLLLPIALFVLSFAKLAQVIGLQ